MDFTEELFKIYAEVGISVTGKSYTTLLSVPGCANLKK